MRFLSSLVPSPTPSFPSLLSIGRGTGNEASFYPGPPPTQGLTCVYTCSFFPRSVFVSCVCVAVLNVSVLSTGSYDYFIQKEIFEQPESVINTMRGRVRYDEYKGTPDLCASAWLDMISH